MGSQAFTTVGGPYTFSLIPGVSTYNFTVIGGGGIWLSTQLFGGHSDEEETKTEQVAPAPVIVNVQQNQENKQKVENGGTNTIIKERVIEKPAQTQPAQTQPKKEEESW